MPKNVIVVGTPRSGTSLTASIFVKKGYFVARDPADQLQKASDTNPSGYWELDDLIEANVGIFKDVGFEHHNTWTSDEIEPRQAEAIFSLEQLEEHKKLARHFKNNQPWIWKDPRFCYTLAYWWPLMNPETTSVLLVTRNPQEIWQSFLRIKWRKDPSGKKSDFLRRMQSHLDSARNTIKRFDIPHVEIDYSDFASKPQDTAELLGSHFGIHLIPEDLGYQKKYNNSTFRGYVAYFVEKLAAALPAFLRQVLKNVTPSFVMRALFPSKSKR